METNWMERVGSLAEELESEGVASEDEGIEDYNKGGYHPVFVGEVLHGRYVVLQKLGWGHFSTVWLSRDVKFSTYVAIKVQKSASQYLEAAFDEVEILQRAVKKSGVDDCHVVQLLNAFIYQGPYGKHFCMVFEILGVNMLEIIKRYDYKGIPIEICREMSKQILLGLHYLHKYCGIIHTDLKPENVMVALNDSELKQIYDEGQLNRKQEAERRLKKIKKRIRAFNGVTSDQLSETEDTVDNLPRTKNLEKPEGQPSLVPF
jgi:serine/threonine-protein kinase SRPK3